MRNINHKMLCNPNSAFKRRDLSNSNCMSAQQLHFKKRDCYPLIKNRPLKYTKTADCIERLALFDVSRLNYVCLYGGMPIL